MAKRVSWHWASAAAFLSIGVIGLVITANVADGSTVKGIIGGVLTLGAAFGAASLVTKLAG